MHGLEMEPSPARARAGVYIGGGLLIAVFTLGTLVAWLRDSPAAGQPPASLCLDIESERLRLIDDLATCDSELVDAIITIEERSMYSALHAEPAKQPVRVGKPVRGIASWMCHEGDRWCGKGSACPLPPLDGVGPDKPRRIVDTDHVFASRNELGIKCGQTVEFCLEKTGKCTYATRGTSGPFGAVLPDGTWVVQIRENGPAKHRGTFDFTTSIKEALGHDGWDEVVMYRQNTAE